MASHEQRLGQVAKTGYPTCTRRITQAKDGITGLITPLESLGIIARRALPANLKPALSVYFEEQVENTSICSWKCPNAVCYDDA